MRIVHIDDNPDDRSLTRRELERTISGIEVVPITESRQLSRELDTGEIDLIVTDYQFGWGNGLDILREIKARRPQCPVVMFTGSGNEEVAVEALKAGLDDYVIKSAKHYTRLSTAVRSALDRAAAARRATYSELRLQALLDRLDVGVFQATPDGQVIEANPAFLRLVGAESPAAVRLGELDRHAALRGGTLLERMSGDALDGFELEIDRAEMGRTWVCLSTIPAVDAQGRPIIDGMAEDITERRQALLALRDSEERYRLLVEGIRDYAVFMVGPDHRISTWNSGAERIFGYSADAAIGQPYDLLFLPAERNRGHSERIVEGAIATGVFEDEGWRRRRDGSQFWARVTATRLQDGEGRTIGVSLLTRDLTERKRAEQELQKASKLESLGILAGGVAHDFNNLLTIIIGHISLARIALDPQTPMVRQLNAAVKACVRAKDLTQQLLTFSTGGAPVKSLIALGALLEEWVTFMLRGTPVRPLFMIAPDLWPVEADAGQINQVINNLVINAHQAMPHGGVLTLRAKNAVIRTHDRLPLIEGPYVRISLTDQGPGIPRDHLSKIFDPFFTTKPGGTGLGLTTSFAIVKKHQGHIRAESPSDGGTTFDVYLPARPAETAHPTEIPSLARTGKGRLLLMDDEPAIRDFFQDLTHYLGYEVECVADGEAAVQRYREARAAGSSFDLVILDLTVVGGLGAKETVTRLRQDNPSVKALISSGYTNDPALVDYRSFGFVGVIFKPYEMEDLSQILIRAMADPGG